MLPGYANEVGESFRPVIPKQLVHASYGVAITYVIADCLDKSLKTYRVRCNFREKYLFSTIRALLNCIKSVFWHENFTKSKLP